MSKTNTFENSFLKLVLQNVAIANIGDAGGLSGSTTAGSLYIALHTADPTESGSQANECQYTGYTRVAVARHTTGFTVTDNVGSNAAAVTFPTCTGGSETATHFSILTDLSGGDMLFSGALTESLAIGLNVTPNIASGALTITEN